MKLDGTDIVIFNDCYELRAVHARGDASFTAIQINSRVGMREIKICVGRNVREQAGGTLDMNLIPSHVRKLHFGWQRANFSGQQIQSAQVQRFLARFVERLQTEANTEERHASRN